MNRYTRGQRLLLAVGLPFGLTIVILNVSSALGASESTKDKIVLVGMCALLVGVGWMVWNLFRKPGS